MASRRTRAPVLLVEGGLVFASSGDVARHFRRRHDNVLRDIDRLIEQEPSLTQPGVLTFVMAPLVTAGTAPTGRSYLMTREGFTLLAMGFTGASARQWKRRYMEAFDQRQVELWRNPPASPLPDLSSIAIRLHEVNRETRKRAKAAEVARLAAEYVHGVVDAPDRYRLQDAAWALGVPPNKFIAWLKQTYLVYQGRMLVPRALYRDCGIFEVAAGYRTYITPRGLYYFAAVLARHYHPDFPDDEGA